MGLLTIIIPFEALSHYLQVHVSKFLIISIAVAAQTI
jgi:hypothetical protein